jgi:site-specific recombinase XerD
MSAIGMLFSWLSEKGILAANPGREVKTEKFSLAEKANPGFRQVQTVLNKIDTSTLEVVQRIAGHADSRTTKLYN